MLVNRKIMNLDITHPVKGLTLCVPVYENKDSFVTVGYNLFPNFYKVSEHEGK